MEKAYRVVDAVLSTFQVIVQIVLGLLAVSAAIYIAGQFIGTDDQSKPLPDWAEVASSVLSASILAFIVCGTVFVASYATARLLDTRLTAKEAS